jgi:eukaryotic-like serine/threonine-protein kinase
MVGPYELLRPLDRSGLFLGRSPDGERVAVTVVPADVAVDPGFRADVAAARLVTGAFIAPVLDADLDASVPWLATAYVDAPSLADKIRDGGPLHASAVLALATWLTIGLQALHAAGVVHRNLNPSNVLLTEDGPRLVEFGISLPAKASAQPDEDFDSPEFSSPEQALGHDIGPASDIFSLGAVLMYAASGHGPFGSGSSAALMYRLVNSPPDLGELPDELRPPVEACLAKQPGSRPTASRLLAEFRAIRPRARAEEVPARPAPGPAAAGAVAGAGAALSATVSSLAARSSPAAVSSPATMSSPAAVASLAALSSPATVASTATVPPPAALASPASLASPTSVSPSRGTAPTGGVLVAEPWSGGWGGSGRGGGGRGGGGRRSDMRLKHDIVLLGRLDDGLGYYRFVYNGGHTAFVGVMAQEVRTVAPDAVTRGSDGYMRVSYDRLGLPFETYDQWVASGAHLPSVKPAAH